MSFEDGLARGMAAPGRVASLLVVFSLAFMPVHAEPMDGLGAPREVAGHYDQVTHKLSLTWLPPDSTATGYVYHIYQDSVLLATTTNTNLTTTLPLGPHVFWITATSEGVESRPSPPVFAHRAEGGHAVAGTATFQLSYGVSSGEECEPIIVHHPQEPPFVDVIVREECLPFPICGPAQELQVRPRAC